MQIIEALTNHQIN